MDFGEVITLAQGRDSGAGTMMCGQGWTFRERCENYLGCKMSGHLDLLCVRERGNGCGYKIVPGLWLELPHEKC